MPKHRLKSTEAVVIYLRAARVAARLAARLAPATDAARPRLWKSRDVHVAVQFAGPLGLPQDTGITVSRHVPTVAFQDVEPLLAWVRFQGMVGTIPYRRARMSISDTSRRQKIVARACARPGQGIPVRGRF